MPDARRDAAVVASTPPKRYGAKKLTFDAEAAALSTAEHVLFAAVGDSDARRRVNGDAKEGDGESFAADEDLVKDGDGPSGRSSSRATPSTTAHPGRSWRSKTQEGRSAAPARRAARRARRRPPSARAARPRARIDVAVAPRRVAEPARRGDKAEERVLARARLDQVLEVRERVRLLRLRR